MTSSMFIIRLIAASHLLQPPLTAWLAKRFTLREIFETLPPLPREIATNMGFASVALPTSCGCLLAAFADEIPRGRGVYGLAWCMAAFWTWRLWRQRKLGGLLPAATHVALCAIFALQGPVLAWLLLFILAHG